MRSVEGPKYLDFRKEMRVQGEEKTCNVEETQSSI